MDPVFPIPKANSRQYHLISQGCQEVRRVNISKVGSLFECWTNKKLQLSMKTRQICYKTVATLNCLDLYKRRETKQFSFKKKMFIKWAVPSDLRALKYHVIWYFFNLQLNTERVIRTKIFPEIVHFICLVGWCETLCEKNISCIDYLSFSTTSTSLIYRGNRPK